MDFYSQIGQDRLIIKYLKNKKNGTFVDIGCGFPKYINNTYLLETEFDWNGVSVDLIMYTEQDGLTWNDCRKTKLVLNDALTINYSSLFKESNLPINIDYLSMDLEPPDLSLECLFKIPFDEYQFNIITFEVDNNREGDENRINKSREFLTSKGYTLIGSLCSGQDDVYLHNSLIGLTNEFKFVDNEIIWTKR
jgi:hypothetical protein